MVSDVCNFMQFKSISGFFCLFQLWSFDFTLSSERMSSYTNTHIRHERQNNCFYAFSRGRLGFVFPSSHPYIQVSWHEIARKPRFSKEAPYIWNKRSPQIWYTKVKGCCDFTYAFGTNLRIHAQMSNRITIMYFFCCWLLLSFFLSFSSSSSSFLYFFSPFLSSCRFPSKP